jgi:hypothetical protein
MAKFTSKQRGNLPKTAFAVPSKAPGSGSYPIPDASHARNALARASGKPVQAKVDAAVHRKFPAIGKPKAEREPPREAAAERRNPKLEARESPAKQRAEAGMDAAVSAHADQMHPLGRGK